MLKTTITLPISKETVELPSVFTNKEKNEWNLDSSPLKIQLRLQNIQKKLENPEISRIEAEKFIDEIDELMGRTPKLVYKKISKYSGKTEEELENMYTEDYDFLVNYFQEKFTGKKK